MQRLRISGRTMALVAVMSARVLASTVTFDGFQWQSLGQAQLTIVVPGSFPECPPECLLVSNIGATGNDGVRLLLPNGSPNEGGLDIGISSGLGTSETPNAAFLQMTPLGTINGITGQLINSLTAMTISGGGVEAVVDMSPISSTSLTAFYYNNGALVLTQTGIPDRYIIPMMDRPNDWGKIDQMGEDFTWFTPVPVPIFGGGTVLADEVLFEPVGSPVTFSGYSAIDFTGSQVDQFLVGTVPEPSTIWLLCLGLGGLALAKWRIKAGTNSY